MTKNVSGSIAGSIAENMIKRNKLKPESTNHSALASMMKQNRLPIIKKSPQAKIVTASDEKEASIKLVDDTRENLLIARSELAKLARKLARTANHNLAEAERVPDQFHDLVKAASRAAHAANSFDKEEMDKALDELRSKEVIEG